jgi:hypothetical protein
MRTGVVTTRRGDCIEESVGFLEDKLDFCVKVATHACMLDCCRVRLQSAQSPRLTTGGIFINGSSHANSFLLTP